MMCKFNKQFSVLLFWNRDIRIWMRVRAIARVTRAKDRNVVHLPALISGIIIVLCSWSGCWVYCSEWWFIIVVGSGQTIKKLPKKKKNCIIFDDNNLKIRKKQRMNTKCANIRILREQKDENEAYQWTNKHQWWRMVEGQMVKFSFYFLVFIQRKSFYF